MNRFLKQTLKKIFDKKPLQPVVTKNEAELNFWRKTLIELIGWYKGEKVLYNTKCPDDCEKITGFPIEHNAILTWHKLHQEPKYLSDLSLTESAFAGMNLLDIGAGPIPSATIFKDTYLYSLDHLMGNYLEIGYPFHYYENTRFVHAKSEAMPFTDGYIDAVISVNAIDHVDDFIATANEIRRILKPGGLFRMHVHYHKKTVCEPIELNDGFFSEAYSWLPGLHKISEREAKFGSKAKPGELYALWSNF
ncbi:MAG: class I SAM-dependent methyltransferase [Chitinophagaceae bacterium]|nr:class I SAM-dependent methyltransferase [Chitinophagaceae bacterium]